jgi:hypothetical protein
MAKLRETEDWTDPTISWTSPTVNSSSATAAKTRRRMGSASAFSIRARSIVASIYIDVSMDNQVVSRVLGEFQNEKDHGLGARKSG